MTQFNLSGWALGHRSFIVYCMLALTVVGAISYYRLGRNEDPAFTFRTMVVQAAWPGATLQETIDQVTERIERTLKETPGLDFLRSYTSAGLATIFVTLKGSTPASEVPDIWYHVRKSVGDMRHTLPAGVVGPGFNDEFGDTFGIIYGFTADGFTHRELRDHVEDVRARLLRVPDVSKVEILGTQDETIIVEFSTEKMAGLGIDRGDVIAALRAQNAVNPAGTLQTGDERLALRVSGAFGSEQDILAHQYRLERPPDPAGRHRRGQARLRRSPATHVQGEWKGRDRHRRRHARRRRHPHARPQSCSGPWTTSPPTCRSASSRRSWPISPPWSAARSASS